MIGFVWMIQLALATGVQSDSVPCPLDGTPIRRFSKVSANTHGGSDSDLASYSTRGQFRTHAVSTCPADLFSMLGGDLNRAIPKSTHPAIQAAIAEVRSTLVDPENPEVWERYAIAAHIYTVLGYDPFEVAELYLNASWTARDAAVGVYVGGLDSPLAARTLLDLGAKELAKDLTVEARKTALYNLARVAHRAGYPDLRDRHATAFLALSSLSADERKAGERLQHIGTTIEPTYQDLAIGALKQGLERPSKNTIQMIRSTYLLAELLRRRGSTSQARPLYTQVINDAETPDALRDLARFFIEDMAR